MDRRSVIKLLLGIPLLVTNVDELEKFFKPPERSLVEILGWRSGILRLFPTGASPLAELVKRTRPIPKEEYENLQWYKDTLTQIGTVKARSS